MALDPQFKMSFQDVNGNYYSAIQNPTTGGYTVSTSAAVDYLNELPKDWDNIAITWQRDTEYMGVFRSASSQGNFGFVNDARGILQYVRQMQGIQGFITFTIWMWDENAFEYNVFYRSQLDFTSYKDDLQNELLTIGSLDNLLIRDIHALGNTQFNIPIWTPIRSTYPVEYTTDAEFLIHDGIKLLYNSTYTSGATSSNPITLGQLTGGGLVGYNHGRFGSDPSTAGAHAIINFTQYNIVQNNGATTYIGNTVLQPFLVQGNQNPGANGQVEERFNGINNSQPYTKNNNSLLNLLEDVTMQVAVSGTFNLAYTDGGIGAIITQGDNTNQFLAFVLWEIDNTDNPPIISGEMQYETILKIPIPDTSGAGGHGYMPAQKDFSNYPGGTYPISSTAIANGTPATITLKKNKAYIFGIIYDSVGGENLTKSIDAQITDLQFSIYSFYDYGSNPATDPIPAPSYPPSIFPVFRPRQLLEKLIPNLATTNTDLYGFPIYTSTPFTGVSDYLSNASAAPSYDLVPYNIGMTSNYCIHDLAGQSYITISLNQFFDFCKKALGCGAAIENDSSGNPNIFRVENLAYFFDNTTMILDLGYDIAEFEISHNIDGIGSNLKLGYPKAQLNNNFGVDSFNTELYYNTPALNEPGTMDYEVANVVTDQYQIELTRSQQTSQPIGSSFDPANPSGDNSVIALVMLPFATESFSGSAGSNVNYPTLAIVDPDNRLYPYSGSIEAYQLALRNGVNLPLAQNYDPTAASQPYINGLYYPESAINVELSPKRNLLRNGGVIHSFLDNMDSQNLIFRHTGIMQYNNVALALSGISSNLDLGVGASPIVEYQDEPISNLPPQLFKPIQFKIKSKYPVNMYQIMNTNSRGYVRWYWTNRQGVTKEYKGFIYKAVQAAGNSEATEFYLWATPDMVV